MVFGGSVVMGKGVFEVKPILSLLCIWDLIAGGIYRLCCLVMERGRWGLQCYCTTSLALFIKTFSQTPTHVCTVSEGHHMVGTCFTGTGLNGSFDVFRPGHQGGHALHPNSLGAYVCVPEVSLARCWFDEWPPTSISRQCRLFINIFMYFLLTRGIQRNAWQTEWSLAKAERLWERARELQRCSETFLSSCRKGPWVASLLTPRPWFVPMGHKNKKNEYKELQSDKEAMRDSSSLHVTPVTALVFLELVVHHVKRSSGESFSFISNWPIWICLLHRLSGWSSCSSHGDDCCRRARDWETEREQSMMEVLDIVLIITQASL